VTDGWRWIFLVNLFIGVVEIPVAIKVIPRGTNARNTAWTSRAARC
jgi:hypothetical protein